MIHVPDNRILWAKGTLIKKKKKEFKIPYLLFSNLKVICFTQQCNTKETYSTEEQGHVSHAFFSTIHVKNCIYASDYPVSEHMKFVCAVNTNASSTLTTCSSLE